jgi:outer membrane immunogenic protein
MLRSSDFTRMATCSPLLCVLAFAALTPAFSAQAQDASWTGFYAGLNAGGTWGTGDTNVACLDTLPPPSCGAAIASGAFVTKMSPNLDGFIGGGQAGYNYQTGNLLLGVEADISWTSADGSTSQTTSTAGINFVTTVKQNLNWLGTARGRVGYATYDWLFYATGGLAFGDVSHSYSNIASTGNNAIVSGAQVQTGWVVGGGGEYSLGHWSVTGEYLYYDLGSESLNAIGQTSGGVLTGNTFQPDFDTNGHIVRAGVNFPLH